MKKIVFFIDSLSNSGGTERVTTVLANYFSEIKHYDISILTINNTGRNFFTLNNQVKVEHLHKKKCNRYTRYIQNLFLIRKFYNKHHPDYWIDVCSALSLMSIPALYKTNVKVITWEHFNANVEWNPITSPLARKIAVKYAYKVITLTRTDKKIYENRFKSNNVLCIPNPITIDKNSPICNIMSHTVLAIGRLEKQKGFDMLLQIWSKTKCKDNGWNLRIIGKGKEKENLNNLIQSLNLSDTVSINTPTSNITTEYTNASIYVMSSRFEGLPLVLIEAASCGMPIISFDCETGPRDIINDGENGILIKPFNLEDFAKELDYLTENENIRQRFSENAKNSVLRFDINAISALWDNILV